MIDLEERIVARGVWLYDGRVPRAIEVHARPARLAGSRFIEAQENPPVPDTLDGFVLDQNAPIPDTPDGFVYHLSLGSGGEFRTLDEAKKWADAQPVGSGNMEVSP